MNIEIRIMMIAMWYNKFWNKTLVLSCFLSVWGASTLASDIYKSPGKGVIRDSVIRSFVSTPFSYEEYLALLEEKAAIPLEQIPLDQDTIFMQERMAWLRKQYKNDKRAFISLRNQYKNIKSISRKKAVDLVEWLEFTMANISAIESVYTETGLSELELINEIGESDFIKRYVALISRFQHLKVLEEARLKECMGEFFYRQYVEKVIVSRLLEQENTGGEACSCECLFHLVAPELPGSSILEWVRKNIKYPVFAMENNIQGTVWVSFVVDCDGSVSRIRVEREVALSLDREAQRVIKCLPQFIPSECRIHHRRVAVLYTYPINFRLR